MPRFYDPTQSDVTVKLINGIQSWFDESKALSHDQIEQLLLRFQIHGKVKITNNCSKGHFFFDYQNALNMQYPVFNDGEQIIICSQFIRNSVQLYENLLREQQYNSNMCDYVRSCAKSYEIYPMSDEEHELSTYQCAKQLFRHRAEKKASLPYDQWLRFVEKQLNEQVCYKRA